MSKMADSLIDVPMNDSDYDYIQIDPEEIKKLNEEENMVGVSYDEDIKFEGDTLSFSPEE